MTEQPKPSRWRFLKFKDYRGPEEETDPELPEPAGDFFNQTRLLVVADMAGPRGTRRLRRRWIALAVSPFVLFVVLHLVLNLGPVTRAADQAARRAIGERFEGAELAGHLRVGWFGALSLDGFRLPGPGPDDPPTLVAERIDVQPAFLSLLAGHLRANSIELRWVRLQTGPEGAWLTSLAKKLSHRKSMSAPTTGAKPKREALPTIVIRDLFIDLPSRNLTDPPLSVGPLDVTGRSGVEGGALTFDVRGRLLGGNGGRFSIAGSTTEGEVTFQGGLAKLNLSDLPPGLFAHKTLEIDDGAFSGDFSGSYADKRLDLKGGLTLARCNVVWPRLANDPVGPFDFGLRGEATIDLGDHSFAVHQTKVTVNKGELTVEASMSRDKAFRVQVNAKDQDMQAAIDALPAQLRPPPQAPRVQGPLSMDFDIAGIVGKWEAFEIRKSDLDLSGLKEAAVRDTISSFLKQPFDFTPGGQEPPARSFEVGPGNPRFTPINTLPSYVVRAVVLSEDGGFFGHHGFDFDEIKESISRDLSKGQAVRGGSTLTQQLVKNLFLSREKKLSRKIQEALITLEIEAALPKWRILEIYLNSIEWGPKMYGIGEASERYFDVRASRLTPKQAAFLATIIPNPKKYYWYFARGGLTRGWDEKVGHLLDKMASVGVIDAAQRSAASAPLVFHRGPAPPVALGPEPRDDSP